MGLTSFADLTIRRKLSVLLLLSSGIGLVVASVALISFAFSSGRTVAERVGRELGVPVLTYGAAVSSTPSCSARSAKRTCASF